MEKVKVIRNTNKPIQKTRLTIQSLFSLLSVWIGVEFYFFVTYLETGGKSFFMNRPPGVDGYLPISSLMSLRYTVATGEIHWAHPAGIFILLAIIFVSLIFGKSFCSWLCPVGLLSESLGDLGEKLFKRKIKMPKFLDYPLRSLKYLMLAFFAYVIFFAMDIVSLKMFLDSPYNQVADIKMYYFFAKISRFSLIVTVVLALLSVLFRNFWCRYLCPYGAFLSFFTFLSPYRIKRNIPSCIDCDKCNKVCPSFINVAKANYVISDECNSCLNCVDACPVKETLEFKSVITKKTLKPKTVAIGIVAIFMAVTGLGMLTNNWQNRMGISDYIIHMKNIESSTYSHPTGTEHLEEINKETSEMNINKERTKQ